MISTSHKFIFVHIPKTAGNSIQTALAKYADDEVRFRLSKGFVVENDSEQDMDIVNPLFGPGDMKHATLRDYHAVLGDSIHEFFVFACVRNPWDRVVSSAAFSAHEHGLAELATPYPPMAHYLDAAVPIDYCMRFEKLQEDFDYVCDRIGVPKRPLPHKHRSHHRHYSEYYNDAQRLVVAQKYEVDIKRFGYGFNN